MSAALGGRRNVPSRRSTVWGTSPLVMSSASLSHCTPNAVPWRASGSEISVAYAVYTGAGAFVTGTAVLGWVASATEKPSSVASKSTHQRRRKMRRYSIGPISPFAPRLSSARPHGFATPRGRQAIPARRHKASPFLRAWKSPLPGGPEVGQSAQRVPDAATATVSFHGAWRRAGAIEYLPGPRSRVAHAGRRGPAAKGR